MEKNIKIVINIFHIFKKQKYKQYERQEEMNKKTKQTPRYEKYNFSDEKYTGWEQQIIYCRRKYYAQI